MNSSNLRASIRSPWVFAETVNIALTSGFRVDEMSEPVNLEVPFGTYASSSKGEGSSW